MDKIQHDILRVKELGELIGYGNMMSLASALWRKKLIESGTPPSGAFIAALEMDIEAGDLDKWNLHIDRVFANIIYKNSEEIIYDNKDCGDIKHKPMDFMNDKNASSSQIVISESLANCWLNQIAMG